MEKGGSQILDLKGGLKNVIWPASPFLRRPRPLLGFLVTINRHSVSNAILLS